MFYINKNNNDSFEGEISSLYIKGIDDVELNTRGYFSTYATEDEGYIEDLNLEVLSKGNWVDFSLIDNSDLCEIIEEKIDWCEVVQDRAILRADYLYDLYKDEGF